MKSSEIKISQYADDTTTCVIIDGSKKTFTSALLYLELGEISGLACGLTARTQKFPGRGLALRVKINYVPKRI